MINTQPGIRARRPAPLAHPTRPRSAHDATVSSFWSVESALSESSSASSASSSPLSASSSSSSSSPSSPRVFAFDNNNKTTSSISLPTPRQAPIEPTFEITSPSDSITASPPASDIQDHIVNTTLTVDAPTADIFSPRPVSHDSVPRQTLLKALATAATKKRNPKALSLLPSIMADDEAPQRQSSSSLSPRPQNNNNTPTTALPALKSPCFYHERLDDAVDIDSILDAVHQDSTMSHSRLVQTATTVRQVSKQLQRRPIKRAVRNVMIITKARDNQLVYLTRELALWLLRTPRYGSDVGVNVHVDAKLRLSRRFGARSIIAMNPKFESMLSYWTPEMCWSTPELFDLVLTLGGDGTVLFTSWLFQRIVPPVLPFALGSLGFLTSFEFERYTHHLDRIMGDDGMRVNLRMRFTCTVFRAATAGEPQEAEQFEVLNELVIDRGPSPYVSNLELFGDDELLTVIQADGCIFSTPTGSTAYSLSAGGSLIHPDIPCILLTPICPHTLSFRPMVLSDTMALRVAIPKNSRATAYCAFDGKGRVELRQGDYVTITASQYPFPTVTRTDTEWFDSVSRTLRWNTRAATQKAFDPAAVVGEGGEDEAVEGEPEWDIDSVPLRKMSLLGL